MAMSGRFLVYPVVLLMSVVVASFHEDGVFGYCGGGFSDPSEVPNDGDYYDAKGPPSANDHEPAEVYSNMQLLYVPPVLKPKISSSRLKVLKNEKRNRTFRIKVWHTKGFAQKISKNETTKEQYHDVMHNVRRFFESFLAVDQHTRNGSHNAIWCLGPKNVKGVQTVDADEYIDETDSTFIDGVEESDYHLVLRTGIKGSCGKEGSSTLAYAVQCTGLTQSLVNSRPLVGLTYLCPNKMTGHALENIAMEATLKHEIFHALGVNSRYLKQAGLISQVKTAWKSAYGDTFQKDITYHNRTEVRDAARLHFDCPDLPGAEVENSGGKGTADSHWEKRVFGPELMTGTISRRGYLSNITVTFMKMLGTESGPAWYPWVNESMMELSWYGKDAGCEFAKGSCKEFIDLQKYNKTWPRTPSFPFCSYSNIKAYFKVNEAKENDFHSEKAVDLGTCSPDHASVLTCYLNTAKDLSQEQLEEKWSFYYNENKQVRGTSEVSEYCATYSDISNTADVDTNCYNPYSQPDASKNFNAQVFGGKNSGCFEQATTFHKTDCAESKWKRILIGKGKSVAGFSGAGCYKFECDNGRLLVRVAGDEGRYGAKACWAAGSKVLIRRMIGPTTFVYGEILCPKCSAFCDHCEPDIVGFNSRDQLEPACHDGCSAIKQLHLPTALLIVLTAQLYRIL